MSTIEGLSTIAIIDSMSSQFTKTDWKIVKFLKDSPIDFTNMSAIEIAKQVGTSDASIIRFAQKIGFDGFYELRTQYKRELEKNDIQSDSEQSNLLENDYSQAIKRLFTLCEESKLNTFVSMISSARSIYVCAFKQYNYLANLFADKFLLLGIKIKAITSMNELRLHSAIADKDDLFIVLTMSTDQASCLHEFQIMKQHDAEIIAISDQQKSKLTDISDLNLTLPKTTDLFSEMSISLNVLFLILIDILFNTTFHSDTSTYSFSLAQSLELTKPEDDYSSESTINKIKAMFEK